MAVTRILNGEHQMRYNFWAEETFFTLTKLIFHLMIAFKYSHIINNTNRQELGFVSSSMTDGVWYPRTLWFRKVPPSLQVRSPVNSHRLLTQHVGKAAPYMDSSEANEYKSNLLQTDYRLCYEI